QQLVLAKAPRGMVADQLAGYLWARTTGHFQSLTSLIIRGCAKAIKTGEEELTEDLLNKVPIDVAAEANRQEMLAALEEGLISAKPKRKRCYRGPKSREDVAGPNRKTPKSTTKHRQPDPGRMLADAANARSAAKLDGGRPE
ncbi:MAG TPA: hypothetical protein VGS21_06820, partial [Acidimicrobiales bacterium]|nr:hypothetical protein [Acidimicrobiales bacterium]